MKFKPIIPYIPELFLLISVLYYWSLTGSLFNPFAIGLLALIVFQILTRKKATGIIISTLFILLNFLLVLALLSELSEFPAFNSDAKTMAAIGFSYLVLNIIIGTWMLVSYLSSNSLIYKKV